MAITELLNLNNASDLLLGLGSSIGTLGNTINELESDLSADMGEYAAKYSQNLYDVTNPLVYRSAQPLYEHENYSPKDHIALSEEQHYEQPQEESLSMYCTTDKALLDGILKYLESHKEHKDTHSAIESA